MIAVLALLAAQAAVQPPVTKFQSTNVVIGACERYVPLDTLVKLDAAVSQASLEMQVQVARWRGQGREMGRADRFDYRICSALLRNAFDQ